MDKKIGQIISNGGTIKELRKAFPNFPKEPTKESFIELGYKESTANKYLHIIKKNSQAKSTKKNSAISNKKTNQKENSIPEKNEIKNFIESERANPKNLLVDTCSLAYADTLKLIDSADHVTFIYSTIEEMDKKSKNYSKNHLLASNIRLYSEKILSDPNKYMLSSFSGNNKEKYPDNILLQYITMLPKQLRPTLLTVDKNLALKAEALDLQYILYLARTLNQNESFKNAKRKKLGFGVKLLTTEEGLFAEYKGPYHLCLIRNNEEIKVTNNIISVEPGDTLCLKQKFKQEIIEHTFEI